MATARKGVFSTSTKSLQRNRELRSVLVFLAANPHSTLRQIAVKFDWSTPKSRNAIESLTQAELIFVSKRELTALRSPVHFFSVCEHDESDLDHELPITKPDSSIVGLSARSSTGEALKRDEYGGWIAGQVRRDPLDLALMGTGIAPSILFHRSQDVQASA